MELLMKLKSLFVAVSLLAFAGTTMAQAVEPAQKPVHKKAHGVKKSHAVKKVHAAKKAHKVKHKKPTVQ
jgi:hypothetical protein